MMPLEKQMWGDEFGMLADRFGIAWMVNIAGDQNAGLTPAHPSTAARPSTSRPG